LFSESAAFNHGGIIEKEEARTPLQRYNHPGEHSNPGGEVIGAAWRLHEVSSPQRKIQFLPLSAGKIRVRLIPILYLFRDQIIWR
jgi:hypothetical protein